MGKTEAINNINSSWYSLIETISIFPVEFESDPGVLGTWSFLDAIIHIFAWDEELHINLKDYLEKNQKPLWSDFTSKQIDKFNQSQVDNYSHLDRIELLGLLEKYHLDLLEYLDTLGDGTFNVSTPIGMMIKDETWTHYGEHMQDLNRFINLPKEN